MREKPLVLVADDEPIVGDTLVQILLEEGYDAIAVSDGAAAVKFALHALPDLVICDVVMPTLDGVEAAKQISKVVPQEQIILFSGQASASDLLDKAAAEGYNFEILAKPIKPEILLSVISRLVASR